MPISPRGEKISRPKRVGGVLSAQIMLKQIECTHDDCLDNSLSSIYQIRWVDLRDLQVPIVRECF